MSLEFEYLLRKSRCEMLISRDDISNDVITIPLALAFNVCIHLQLFPRFVLFGGNLTVSSVVGEP